jgi:hypothetical protein
MAASAFGRGVDTTRWVESDRHPLERGGAAE